MAKIVQMYRGTTAQVGNEVGPIGQLIVDTTRGAIRVQDGATPGGSITLQADHNLDDVADKAAAKSNLNIGTAADHDTSYFDLAGSADDALVAAKAYADVGDAATLVTAKAYTDTAKTQAEAFATAADIVVTNAAAADATSKANAAETAAEAYTDALPNGSRTTIYYAASGSPSGGVDGDLYMFAT